MHVTQYVARDLQETSDVAASLAATLGAGDVVALHGALGSGKTAFIAAAVRSLVGDDVVTSPTFTFWHRYDGPPLVHHLDLYRVEDAADLATIGLEDAFTNNAIVFIEWPERGEGVVPDVSVHVTIAGAGDDPRTIEIMHA